MAEQDKLQITVDALRRNPNLTNEEIARLLGLSRSMSAIFWKVKAQQILQQEQGKGQ